MSVQCNFVRVSKWVDWLNSKYDVEIRNKFKIRIIQNGMGIK